MGVGWATKHDEFTANITFLELKSTDSGERNTLSGSENNENEGAMDDT